MKLLRPRDQFWGHGYAGTSLDDLVAVTGLGRGSLYGAFGDKHTIFMRALDEYSTATMAAVRAELRDSAESAYDRLVGHIRSMARVNATDSKRRGCLTAKSAAELGATDKAVARGSSASLIRTGPNLQRPLQLPNAKVTSIVRSIRGIWPRSCWRYCEAWRRCARAERRAPRSPARANRPSHCFPARASERSGRRGEFPAPQGPRRAGKSTLRGGCLLQVID